MLIWLLLFKDANFIGGMLLHIYICWNVSMAHSQQWLILNIWCMCTMLICDHPFFLQYHIGQDGRGTVDEISVKLRDGCPSFYNESDYKYFLAVECLERAVATKDAGEREILARDAYNFLSKIPDSADLSSVCKRFADLR